MNELVWSLAYLTLVSCREVEDREERLTRFPIPPMGRVARFIPDLSKLVEVVVLLGVIVQ